ncbi:MAG TPA: hypothetical protein O0X23_02255 [Methanocorpusculum sp.]|nr:hypothetical protein [Methanocorpusculum sp.]
MSVLRGLVALCPRSSAGSPRLPDSHEKLIENLEAVKKDIDEMISDVIVSGRSVFQNSVGSEIFLAPFHSSLTLIEL